MRKYGDPFAVGPVANWVQKRAEKEQMTYKVDHNIIRKAATVGLVVVNRMLLVHGAAKLIDVDSARNNTGKHDVIRAENTNQQLKV